MKKTSRGPGFGLAVEAAVARIADAGAAVELRAELVPWFKASGFGVLPNLSGRRAEVSWFMVYRVRV